LAFPVAELPELDRGKGNKLIEIPKAKRGTERVVAVAVVPPGGTLVVKSGARTMTLSYKDLDTYLGARASRGGLLPRGWQKVDDLNVGSRVPATACGGAFESPAAGRHCGAAEGGNPVRGVLSLRKLSRLPTDGPPCNLISCTTAGRPAASASIATRRC